MNTYKLFSEADIFEIYQRTKKDDFYFKKYVYLSEKEKNFLEEVFSNKTHKWYKRDFPRAIALLDFNEWVSKYKINPKKLFYTSEDDPELKILNGETNILISYNGKEGDLHNFKLNEKCDFFLFNQTIEHLYNPFLAVKNIFDHIEEGGYVFTTVPTINIPHSTPIHFNGYTPMGLAMLFSSCGFNIIETGQWGNYNYLQKLFSTHSWPGYEEIKNDISNQENNVCQCWILCKKQ